MCLNSFIMNLFTVQTFVIFIVKVDLNKKPLVCLLGSHEKICFSFFRKNVRKTFMDGGRDDWSYILKQRADVVLPVLVLMAESKDTEDTEHDTDGTENVALQ